MSQSTRLYGRDIDVFTVGGTNYIGILENVSLVLDFDTQEGVALKDVWHYPIGIRMGSVLRGTMFVDTASLAAVFIAGLQVACVVETGPSTTADRYTFNALMTHLEHAIPDNAQTNEFELVVQGAVTRAASS